jgi:hypothetical protein
VAARLNLQVVSALLKVIFLRSKMEKEPGAAVLLAISREFGKSVDLGQAGGRNNRRLAVDLQVPDDLNATDLSNLTSRAMHLLLSGDLQPRVAIAFVQLCNMQLRLLQGTDLEERVATVETELAHELAKHFTNAGKIAQEGQVAGKRVERAAEAVVDADPEITVQPAGAANANVGKYVYLNATEANAPTGAPETEKGKCQQSAESKAAKA